MAHFRVAQNGKNAVTDPVQDMLIDSDYQTMLISGQGNYVWPASSVAATYPLGIPLSFSPFVTLIVYGSAYTQDFSSTSFSYQIPLPTAGLAEGLCPPGYSTTYPDQWIWLEPGSNNTASPYMYYVYYLPSMGSPSNAVYPPSNNPPYINVTKFPDNAYITSLQNISWTSQVQSLQIINQSTFNISASIPANSNQIFTFTNPVGYSTPFMAMVQNYTSPPGYSYSIPSNSICNFDIIQRIFGDNIGIDNNSFYYYYNNGAGDAVTVNFNITVYFFVQPL